MNQLKLKQLYLFIIPAMEIVIVFTEILGLSFNFFSTFQENVTDVHSFLGIYLYVSNFLQATLFTVK